jgi:hypothetical protein
VTAVRISAVGRDDRGNLSALESHFPWLDADVYPPAVLEGILDSHGK